MTKKDKVKKQIEFIKENSYNGYIDKHLISNYFNISDKTVERRLISSGIKHMSFNLILMMADIMNGMPSLDVAKKYNCSLENVNQFSRRHNLIGRYQYRHKGYKDPFFFDNIDSNIKAYILGFIAADGHVSDKEISICLSSVDREILEKIRNEIGFESQIKDGLSIGSYGNSAFSKIRFGTKEMIKSLRLLGFNSDKTINFKTPSIKKEFLIDYYRGLVDGDGSFSKSIYNNKSIKLSFSLCGTKETLDDFRNFFSEYGIKFNNNLYKRFNTEKCCYTLVASGKDNVMNLLDILYSNADKSLYLSRKYNKYLSFKM